jgi:hypothetical protein
VALAFILDLEPDGREGREAASHLVNQAHGFWPPSSM